jgi:hypothetical protein
LASLARLSNLVRMPRTPAARDSKPPAPTREAVPTPGPAE